MDASTLIDRLTNCFREHGKILSRKEYRSLKKRPASLWLIEKIVGGWGKAQSLASARLLEDLKKDSVVSECHQPEPEAEPEDRFQFYTPRHAMLAGLKKKGMPQKFRLMVAELISRIDDIIEDLPSGSETFSSSSDKEAACIVLSDLHAGKEVRDDRGDILYNKEICLDRISLFTSQVIELLTKKIQPDNIDEIIILLVGDLVDGSGIYETQYLHQDLHYIQDQVALVVAVIWGLVKKLRAVGWKVRLHGVRGNHGRQGKFAPAENNFDLLVYQALKMMAFYEDPQGVLVEYSEATYMNVRVKGLNVHLRHIAPPQTETPSAKAKYGGWQRIHGWDVLVCGHLHHPGNPTYMDSDVIMNGSIVGIDDLAEEMGTFSTPSQTLFGVNKEGLTFRYAVKVGKQRLPRAA